MVESLKIVEFCSNYSPVRLFTRKGRIFLLVEITFFLTPEFCIFLKFLVALYRTCKVVKTKCSTFSVSPMWLEYYVMCGMKGGKGTFTHLSQHNNGGSHLTKVYPWRLTHTCMEDAICFTILDYCPRFSITYNVYKIGIAAWLSSALVSVNIYRTELVLALWTIER